MADEVKLYVVALNFNGIEYENFEDYLSNKSADLLKYTPVHKKLPCSQSREITSHIKSSAFLVSDQS
ncbi:hypothetical protein L6452_40674 [Arctium lappa]|uniref:Uncharacterized protein n=1 Tax=Arctium lappa TaxID=4217 RepID=A0ACB8XRQ3_ARCLA|nr:hypothetical protein L6452_40674 [Arctium lappa]